MKKETSNKDKTKAINYEPLLPTVKDGDTVRIKGTDKIGLAIEYNIMDGLFKVYLNNGKKEIKGIEQLEVYDG